MVSIVIINYNTTKLVKECLKSFLLFHNKENYEVIVVDNNSNDQSINTIKEILPDVKLIHLSENYGFGKANNIAIAQAKGEYYLFLNSDTLFIENSVEKMVNFFNKFENIGILGPKLLNQDKSFQLSAGNLPTIMNEFKDKVIYYLVKNFNIIKRFYEIFFYNKVKEVEWVTGACLLIDKNTFQLVKGFDENIFLYFEDKDLCARVKNVNKKIVYYPETAVVHLLAGSSGKTPKGEIKKYYRKSQIYYYKKHLGKINNLLLKIYLNFMEK